MGIFWLILACVVVGVVTSFVAGITIDELLNDDVAIGFSKAGLPILSVASVIIMKSVLGINLWIAAISPILAALLFLAMVYIFAELLYIDELPAILVSLAIFLVLISIYPCLKLLIIPNWKWTLFILACLAVGILICIAIALISGIYDDDDVNTGIGVICGVAYLILSIVTKAAFKFGFFLSACIPIPIFLVVGIINCIRCFRNEKNEIDFLLWRESKIADSLINTDLSSLDDALFFIDSYQKDMHNLAKEIKEYEKRYEKIKDGWFNGGEKKEILNQINLLKQSREAKRNEDEQKYENMYSFVNNSLGFKNVEFYFNHKEAIKDEVEDKRAELIAEREEIKRQAFEQIEINKQEQAEADDASMREDGVRRNIRGLNDYINRLSSCIGKKNELPDVQIIADLNTYLESLLDNKSYISKEDFMKIRNGYEAFNAHIFNRCRKMKSFSGSILQTRMNQMKDTFKKIIK